jgi:hypothetical protein
MIALVETIPDGLAWTRRRLDVEYQLVKDSGA